MKFAWGSRGFADYNRLSAELSAELQDQVDKQLDLLLMDLRYPSLRAKKYDESRDIWQARVTGSWRFYFRIMGDTYEILAIIKHPK